jgi:stage II sporulation protein D
MNALYQVLWAIMATSPLSPPPDMVRVAHTSPTVTLTVKGGATWATDQEKGGAATITVRLRAGRLEVRHANSWRRVAWLRVTPRAGRGITWGRHSATGPLRLQAIGGRLVGVESMPLERYVAGVVRAEMGRVGQEAPAALEAQAILARTYVLRNHGKYGAAPYDVWASVRDQAYLPESDSMSVFARAARATAGLVLRDSTGNLADVFYHSTCGGRTERGVDLFAGADRPYLPSVNDVDSVTGRAYCADSPHSQWEYELRAAALQHILRRVTAVAVTDTSSAGRVRGLTLQAGGRSAVLTGHDIRGQLSRPGQPLRSTAFRVKGGTDGRWTLTGRGWGHGVGLCQYGAVGRAQAGATHRDILEAYFPGTRITR